MPWYLALRLMRACDVYDVPRLAVMATHFDSTVREELCSLKPMSDTTKGEVIARLFMEHSEERGIDIGTIFAVSTDATPPSWSGDRGEQSD